MENAPTTARSETATLASVIRLSPADQQCFADALLDLTLLAPAMERARERHRTFRLTQYNASH